MFLRKKIISTRQIVKSHCGRSNKPVFHKQNYVYYSMNEISDHLEIIEKCSVKEKKNYLEGQGLNIQEIEQLYEIVKSLNYIYYRDSNSKRSMLEYIITIVQFIFHFVF